MTEREEFEAEYRRRYPTTLKKDSLGIYVSYIVRLSWEFWQAARRTTPDREAIIDELCLALWDVRRLTGELSGDQIWMIKEHFRSLKTAPNGDKK